MVRATIKSTTYSTRKYAASRKAVARAAALLRGKMGQVPRAPLRSGGFYGLYSGRGRNELKVIDVDNISGAIPNTGTLTLLNGVATGTDYTARIGRKIIMKSLLLRVFMLPSSTVPVAVGDFIRVMVIFDCQANSAAPTVADILTTAVYDSPINLNNRDRFKILTDKYFGMNPNNYAAGVPTAGSPVVKRLQVYKKMSLETIFSGTGATIGSIQSGSLYLLVINLVNNGSQADIYSRVRFIDA